MIVRMFRIATFLLLAAVPAWADLSGRWSAGGAEVFVLRHSGNAVTGTIIGKPGEPTYKIVDGTVRGSELVFFVLHDAPDDPEVKANGGLPFHNLAKGTRSLSPGRERTPRSGNTR